VTDEQHAGGHDRRSGGPRRAADDGGRSGRRAGGGGAPRGAGRKGSTPAPRRTGPPGLDVPGGAAEPIGRDRATGRVGAPPRRRPAPIAPPRPELPDDEEAQLPRGVAREIERVLGKGAKSKDVALALSIGSAAIDEERPDIAIEMLAWAKHEAPRIASIREAYGVALYLGERYDAALTELQAYRRMTGAVDQNHLIADCLRALDRGLDRVAETAEALVRADDAPEERRSEAAIVWAAATADAGSLSTARAILRRTIERRRGADEEHDLRVRYLAGELAERDGDLREARAHFEWLATIDPDLLDVADRLDAL
jgi:tetratricopeptide (TPR) repeat protein